MKIKGKIAVRHVIVWAIWFHFFFDFTGLFDSLIVLVDDRQNEFDEAFILMPLMIGLFYANSGFLIPRFLQRKKRLMYTAALLLLSVVYLFSALVLYDQIVKAGYQMYIGFEQMVDVLVLSGVLIIAVSLSLGLTKMIRHNVAERKAAEQRQRSAELDYLSSKVNPHFLFNSLNSLYYLSEEEEATKTSESILKLSEIMHYPIREDLRDTNTIRDEINFISDYIDLQKIRLGASYPIDFEQDVASEIASKHIAPFLFIPLVENAFKYGTSIENMSPIRILLKATHHTISLKTENTIQPSKEMHSGQFGLKNVKHRLELIYPDKGTLTIVRKKATFSAEIKIDY